ncbi:MAG TPA: DUF1629 domain-containing protein [Gemmatimonadales bacterium]|nr:DUF1629 domain-containing protein [Gemmatimonadales bacterium]
MPYSLYRDLTAGGGALIDQTSHWDVNLFSGAKLPPDFEVPLTFEIDLDTEGRRMPTLFMVPALVARKPFFDALLRAGVDNVDAYATVISNTQTGERFTDYLFLNVVGRVAAADLAASAHRPLGGGMQLIDQITIPRDRLPQSHIFRLAEDELKVVISDSLYEKLAGAGFDDVYFQPVTVR